jgi:hypothetical protein
MLYTFRSERLLTEKMDYNLLLHWFVGLNADDEVWGPTTFTKNRDRLLQADVAKEFLARVVGQASCRGLTSDEHFMVDGVLAGSLGWSEEFSSQGEEAWASAGWSGQPDGRLSRREAVQRYSQIDNRSRSADGRKGPGKESKLRYSGNLLVENRNGLISGGGSATNGLAGARSMGARRGTRATLSAKEGGSQSKNVSAGWRRLRWWGSCGIVGVCKVDWIFTFACAAYNLVRMRNLGAEGSVV